MKISYIILSALLLAGCYEKTDTQLIIDTGKKIQYAIDSSHTRMVCEKLARGRERVSERVLNQNKSLGCEKTIRSGLDTNFTDIAVYRSSLLMVCGEIAGRSFTGSTVSRQFIYSPGEEQLLLEPFPNDEITRLDESKTFPQRYDDFLHQKSLYCK